jgi:hypothetical protein
MVDIAGVPSDFPRSMAEEECGWRDDLGRRSALAGPPTELSRQLKIKANLIACRKGFFK